MPLTVPNNPDPAYLEAFLIFTPPGSTSQYSIVFDAVLGEDWNEDAQITEHPVEQGANVADHIRVSLIKCTLKVRVSNEPLDSNTFADPIGGAGETTALAIDPSGGAGTPPAQQLEPLSSVTVPTWRNNLDVAVALGVVAGTIATAAAAAGDAAAGALGLGNATAASLKLVRTVTQTGNEVPSYEVPQFDTIGGEPVQSVGDAVGALTFEAITSLVPKGEEVDVDVPVATGLPPTTTKTVVAQTVQFAGQQDFAALMIALLTRLKNSAQLFTLIGSKQAQTSMAIETLGIHRGAPEDTGTGCEITIGLKQLRLVTTNTVAAPLPSVPRATTPANGGAADGSETPAPQAQSVLRGIASFLFNEP